ncbi:17952_t:CDS:2, partial [Racocetra persica]
MSTSNETTNIDDKDCSGCGKIKPASEFTRRFEIQNKSLDNIHINTDNHENSSELLYEICDIEELIAIHFKNSEENDSKVEFSTIVKIENELINEETFLSESNFEELLAPELDYEEMLLPELDHEEILSSELDQNEMLSLELDKKDKKKICKTKSVSKSSSTQNTSVLVTNRYEIIENRKDELNSDLKMFEML